ncbi:MAG: isoleucine--tRNA ligase [Myxococcaceae bacterium]|nr:isoleucine--tRNA ligase [Myxococcaceae bacterium]
MTAPTKDYKATLNLPQTEFPMKGNLAQLEPKTLERWDAQGLFAKVVDARPDGKRFVLHDGPPYANGRLHAGHALNKILKDIVVKFKALTGHRADYVPGWDCHGLPIEQAVEKRLRENKVDRASLSRDEFLQKCREYALEFIDVQREQFKRMGVLGRWADPYRTLTFDYEAQEIRELAKFAAQGSLFRKKKPVYWCLTDATALAEAEVEYDDHTSPSVYVAFSAKGDLGAKFSALQGKPVDFVIWTTTPWTLPANLAICANPKLEYVFYALNEKRTVCVAKGLLPRFLEACAADHLKVKQVAAADTTFDAAVLVDPTRVLAYATGEELAGLEYSHVFYPRTGKVLLGDHVTLDAGTGLVHTAPGHGTEDYEVGLAHGLEVYNPVRHDGKYDDSVGERLAGTPVFEANPKVIAWLVELGVLLNPATDTLKHSYPHCWRCHRPIIFRATPQWFIGMEKNGLREKALAAIDHQVKWVPAWGRDRIRGMLETRPDWCISRQRTWGVPIPIALCEGCDEPHVDAGLMGRVADAVEKEGAGVWYRTPVEQFLAPGAKCAKCGKSAFRRETDILDVWFDSACSYAAVAAKRPNMSVPVDLYLEGSDQHRGWFHSSLLVGAGTMGKAPYQTCLTHGFVVDGNGNKMSKSLGNTVGPEEIIKQHGAEVMRLWVASSDYRDDVRLSKPILESLSDSYRKVRNTIRYALSNLYDFDPAKHAVAALQPLDAWALSRHQQLVARVRAAYEAFEFHTVHHAVIDYCAADLSAVYFDILKDKLYTLRKDGPERRSAQTVLYRVAKELIVVLAPIMSFTCEEAYGFLPGAKLESVFLENFPGADGARPSVLAETYDALFQVRAGVLPLLEAARQKKAIGKSLEAKLVVFADGATRALLDNHRAELPELFIVSGVELVNAAPEGATAVTVPTGTLQVLVAPAEGNKCPRCWRFQPEVGAQELCGRCTEAVR